MTFNEIREILSKATWPRETSLVALFDELIENYNVPLKRKHYDGTGEEQPGRVTQAFADVSQPSFASGQVVQLVLSLRHANGLPIYEVRG